MKCMDCDYYRDEVGGCMTGECLHGARAVNILHDCVCDDKRRARLLEQLGGGVVVDEDVAQKHFEVCHSECAGLLCVLREKCYALRRELGYDKETLARQSKEDTQP